MTSSNGWTLNVYYARLRPCSEPWCWNRFSPPPPPLPPFNRVEPCWIEVESEVEDVLKAFAPHPPPPFNRVESKLNQKLKMCWKRLPPTRPPLPFNLVGSKLNQMLMTCWNLFAHPSSQHRSTKSNRIWSKCLSRLSGLSNSLLRSTSH